MSRIEAVLCLVIARAWEAEKQGKVLGRGVVAVEGTWRRGKEGGGEGGCLAYLSARWMTARVECITATAVLGSPYSPAASNCGEAGGGGGGGGMER